MADGTDDPTDRRMDGWTDGRWDGRIDGRRDTAPYGDARRREKKEKLKISGTSSFPAVIKAKSFNKTLDI